MHVHILGICGTFMGGLALLAREMGHKVTGSDTNVYPPMSTQLEEQGITLTQGFDPSQLHPTPDIIVIGNAMSRGNPCVETILNEGLAYTSGPQFLHDHILANRWVLGVSGTHGKTSTASMLAWILEKSGKKPGFLIGGVPQNFGISARLGDSEFFIVEADEYDSAFFDKRSKFVHYHPKTLIINNLEFDHADIFENLAAIQKQFHHLIRTVPSEGKIIWPKESKAVAEVIAQGCWSNQETLSHQPQHGDWSAKPLTDDCHQFELFYQQQSQGIVNWDLIGRHNIDNAIMACAAAYHAGVKPEQAIDALASFKPTKRRLELLDTIAGISVYDDFAHHPTAIAVTLNGIRSKVKTGKITVILEPRSNTMKSGVHKDTLANSMIQADEALLYQDNNINWDMAIAMNNSPIPIKIFHQTDAIIKTVLAQAAAGDTILIMSNGGFDGLHQKLLTALREKHAK